MNNLPTTFPSWKFLPAGRHLAACLSAYLLFNPNGWSPGLFLNPKFAGIIAVGALLLGLATGFL